MKVKLARGCHGEQAASGIVLGDLHVPQRPTPSRGHTARQLLRPRGRIGSRRVRARLFNLARAGTAQAEAMGSASYAAS